MENLTVSSADAPNRWRIAHLNEDGFEEELVLKVQGILCNSDLPPFLTAMCVVFYRKATKRSSANTASHRNAKGAVYARQSATLTLLNLAHGDRCTRNILELQGIFDRHFPQGSLQPWSEDTHLDLPAINLSNRYFSHIQDIPGAPIIPFGSSVDPKGLLQLLSSNSRVHTRENVVEYYERSHVDGR